MKIRILTQPLGHNIGGILQNYALTTVCKKFSKDVKTINISRSTPIWFPIIKYGASIKRIFLKVFVDSKTVIRWWLEEKKIPIPQKNDVIYLKNYKQIRNISFSDTITIFGSDQVWRKEMSPDIMTFFGKFLKDNIPRIAYAASFGLDSWQFDERKTAKIISLLKKFKAISVREESAVKLLAERGIHAQLALDPTMLLQPEDYTTLETTASRQTSATPHIFLYCLDKHFLQDDVITLLCKKKHISVKNAMENLQIDNWISGLRTADYVITDSFHGTIFSILFHKKFIVVANENRGLTRLQSLLKMFGLENRLIMSFEDFDYEKLDAGIDYESFDAILNQKKLESLDFLSAYCSP